MLIEVRLAVETAALGQLHGVVEPILVFADVVDADQVFVFQVADQSQFTQGAGPVGTVAQLQSDDLAKMTLPCSVHHSLTALADQIQQFIVAKESTRTGGSYQVAQWRE